MTAYLPEPPRPWPAPRRRRAATLTAATLRRWRAATLTAATLRRWRAAGLDPAAVVVVLKGGAA